MTQKITVVVPGTTGTTLVLPVGGTVELIWPNAAVANPNELVNLLTQSGIEVGQISTAYYPLMEGIAKQSPGALQILANPQLVAAGSFLPQTSNDVVIGFGYDWRLDVETSAGELVNLLGQIYAAYGPTAQLYIVAHSMGGLLSRYVWEGGLINNEVAGIFQSLTTLGTPHLGAPLALAAITGELPSALLSLFGLSSSEVQQFVDNPHFPSTYELLPPPGTNFLHAPALLPKDNISIYEEESPTAYSTLINPIYGASSANMSTAYNFWNSKMQSPQNLWLGKPNLNVVYGSYLLTYETFTYNSSANNGAGQISVDAPTISGDTIVPTSSASFPAITGNSNFKGKIQAFAGVDHDSLPRNSNVIPYVASLIYPETLRA